MNKQIEEMAREMCHLSAKYGTCQICDKRHHGNGDPCYFQRAAMEIINHDYRKASDVAREIFAEIEPWLDDYRNNYCTGLQFITFLAELKKKYTDGWDTNALTKESEGADDEQT